MFRMQTLSWFKFRLMTYLIRQAWVGFLHTSQRNSRALVQRVHVNPYVMLYSYAITQACWQLNGELLWVSGTPQPTGSALALGCQGTADYAVLRPCWGNAFIASLQFCLLPPLLFQSQDIGLKVYKPLLLCTGVWKAPALINILFLRSANHCPCLDLISIILRSTSPLLLSRSNFHHHEVYQPSALGEIPLPPYWGLQALWSCPDPIPTVLKSASSLLLSRLRFFHPEVYKLSASVQRAFLFHPEVYKPFASVQSTFLLSWGLQAPAPIKIELLTSKIPGSCLDPTRTTLKSSSHSSCLDPTPTIRVAASSCSSQDPTLKVYKWMFPSRSCTSHPKDLMVLVLFRSFSYYSLACKPLHPSRSYCPHPLGNKLLLKSRFFFWALQTLVPSGYYSFYLRSPKPLPLSRSYSCRPEVYKLLPHTVLYV